MPRHMRSCGPSQGASRRYNGQLFGMPRHMRWRGPTLLALPPHDGFGVTTAELGHPHKGSKVPSVPLSSPSGRVGIDEQAVLTACPGRLVNCAIIPATQPYDTQCSVSQERTVGTTVAAHRVHRICLSTKPRSVCSSGGCLAVTTRQFQLSMCTLPWLTSVLGKLGAPWVAVATPHRATARLDPARGPRRHVALG